MPRDTAIIAAFLSFAGVAAAGAHGAQQRTDLIRFDGRDAERQMFLPNAEALKVGVLGYDVLAADLMWVRTVLIFSDIYDKGRKEDAQWLTATLKTVTTLDPRWRTAYFYGGSMLRVVNDIDGSDEIYTRARTAIPDDPYFPFSLAMNAYLYRDDPDAASRYLNQAAQMPRAPDWYHAAAATFLDRRGQRRTALKYLKEQIEAEPDPDARAPLERKYRSLLHDELVDRIAEQRATLAQERGHDIRSVAELGPLPEDPEGGHWILASDGVVRSDLRDELLRANAQLDERVMLADPGLKPVIVEPAPTP